MLFDLLHHQPPVLGHLVFQGVKVTLLAAVRRSSDHSSYLMGGQEQAPCARQLAPARSPAFLQLSSRTWLTAPFHPSRKLTPNPHSPSLWETGVNLAMQTVLHLACLTLHKPWAGCWRTLKGSAHRPAPAPSNAHPQHWDLSTDTGGLTPALPKHPWAVTAAQHYMAKHLPREKGRSFKKIKMHQQGVAPDPHQRCLAAKLWPRRRLAGYRLPPANLLPRLSRQDQAIIY